MKISIFNVKYSDNLGDGIIAECLESLLKQYIPDCEILSIDLTGRESFGGKGTLSSTVKEGKLRSFLMSAYAKLPDWFRLFLFTKASQRIIKKTLSPYWLKQINQSDIVIVGGGQLFCNHMLYFPIRLDALALELNKTNKPMAIYGVGVDKSFSDKASRLLSTITKDKKLFFASVRDEDSKDSWNTHFDSYTNVVTRDPGLLTYEVYADNIQKEHVNKNIKTVGINLMKDSTAVLNQTGENRIPLNENLFYDVGTILAKQGFNVVYFTNGAPVDEAVKEIIKNKIKNSEFKDFTNISFIDRLINPTDLAVTISKLDVLIAHRLHANILSYSLKIPHTGIGWSIKMNSFFDAIDRSKYFIPADLNLNAEVVVNKAIETLNEGINELVHKQVVAEARSGVELLGKAIKEKYKS